MEITARDLEILKAINSFGFVDINYIIKRFNMHSTAAYRRLHQLVKNDLLIHQGLLHRQPGVYRGTKLSTEFSHDVLPPLKSVSLATYDHQLKVAHLSLVLLEKSGGEFITQRHIRNQSGISAVGQKSHKSDGTLVLPNKRIAIEVELTPKSRERLEKIIRHYRKELAYQEVWYFCGDQHVRNKLEKIVKNSDFIKCFNLNEFINPQLKETS